MKTKILGGIALLSISAIIAFNVSLNLKKTDHSSLLALANVEALASESTNYDYSECSILTWNRGYMEDWETIKIDADMAGSLSIPYKGKIYTLAQGSVSIGTTVRVPVCVKSDGNCCVKTHVDKAVIYL